MDVSRYVDTTTLEFEVEFITPTFLGGADGNAEIRTAPFKHGIRYWWRVLYGSKYGEKIKEKEDFIFGSTEKKSNIQIFVSNLDNNSFLEKQGFSKGKRVPVIHRGRERKINILDYLAYGKNVKGSGNVYQSTYIKPKTRINVVVSIKDVGHTEEIKNAIKTFIRYGGVGSRSRNGFGSMNTVFNNLEFDKNVQLSGLRDFPVFSRNLHFFRTKKAFDTWEEALSEIGEIYKNARCSLEKTHQYENRGFIARPIEANETIPNNIRKDRIPKPFYLGVMKDKEKFVGYILCLPIMFYEKNKQNEYINQINKMIQKFSESLKNETDEFIKQFIGGDSK